MGLASRCIPGLCAALFSVFFVASCLQELPCRAEDASCDAVALLTLQLNRDVSSTGSGSTPPLQVYLFSSNALHGGSWGDRGASSFACSSERTTYKPGLPCTNDLSFLSYPGDPMGLATTNHGVPAGVPVVSETDVVVDSSWAALFDGSITTSFDAAGITSIGTTYWTGTAADGSTAGDHCNGWTDASLSFNGAAGLRTSTDPTWVTSSTPTCNGTRHYICICW